MTERLCACFVVTQDACDERVDTSPSCPDWTKQATIDDPLPQCDPNVERLADGKTVLRPMLPCARNALDALAAWVEGGVAPPVSGVIPRPLGASASDLANRCDLVTIPRS